MRKEPKTWVCKKCDTEKPIDRFRVRMGVFGLGVDNICKQCRGRSEFNRLKLEMLEAFGWKCACCGETHPQFLTLEHIQGISVSWKRTSTYMEYYRAKREGWDPAKYECLCMNCNFAKGHYGQCPHRIGLTTEQAIESLRQTMKGIGYSHRNNLGGYGRFKKGFDARRSGTKKQVEEVLTRIEAESIER